MRVGVILNPASGRRQPTSIHDRLDRLAASWGAGIEVRVLGEAERVEDAVHAWDGRMDVIGAVGGDGTLNGVVNGVLTSSAPETPVFFVPTGRGRDTARTLPSWSVNHADPGIPPYTRRMVDVGRVTTAEGERYFVNASSTGVSAVTARLVSGYPRFLGSPSYTIAAVHALLRERPFEAVVTLEGQGPVRMPRCHIVVVANGRYFGGGMQVAPDADPEDGYFEVLALANATPRDLVAALPMLLRGTHLRHRKVHYWRSASVTISTLERPLLESDGEQWTTAPARFTVVPHALTWLEPT